MIKKIRFEARLTNEELKVIDDYVLENKEIGSYKNNRSLTIEWLIWQFFLMRKHKPLFEYKEFGCLFLNRNHIMLSNEVLNKCKLFVKNKPKLCSRAKKSGINDIIRTAISFHEYLKERK